MMSAIVLVDPGKSVMVHVEGTRSLECRTPVSKMSGAFIDMAVRTDSPIVPVRFVGGLPTEPLETRTEFPIGMGTQDMWFGRPLLPAELSAVPLRERKALVVDAINDLGPSNATEEPNPSDPAFAASVDAWVEQTGTSHEHATILRMLQALDDPTPGVQAILAAIDSGELVVDDTPVDRWTAELARRLFGERGPTVRI